ncbi:MAG TPA: peptidase [Ramlibacter sp.]|nr:peptidase [Ramlibacter sp.]
MKLLAHCICCAVLAASAVAAWADVSRDAAAAAAQRLGGGRVLSVEKSESARRPVWRVKVVTAQGEVKVILIDAASGQPM